MRNFTIQHIDHIVLRVKDIERSLAFYTSVLGCELKKRRDDLGMLHLSTGVSMIDLVAVDGPLGRVAVVAVGAYNVGRISAAVKWLQDDAAEGGRERDKRAVVHRRARGQPMQFARDARQRAEPLHQHGGVHAGGQLRPGLPRRRGHEHLKVLAARPASVPRGRQVAVRMAISRMKSMPAR